jgi:hypothetical protein
MADLGVAQKVPLVTINISFNGINGTKIEEEILSI